MRPLCRFHLADMKNLEAAKRSSAKECDFFLVVCVVTLSVEVLLIVWTAG